jgi:hypothetical protein
MTGFVSDLSVNLSQYAGGAEIGLYATVSAVLPVGSSHVTPQRRAGLERQLCAAQQRWLRLPLTPSVMPDTEEEFQ